MLLSIIPLSSSPVLPIVGYIWMLRNGVSWMGVLWIMKDVCCIIGFWSFGLNFGALNGVNPGVNSVGVVWLVPSTSSIISHKSVFT